jgi:hypothetical protein
MATPIQYPSGITNEFKKPHEGIREVAGQNYNYLKEDEIRPIRFSTNCLFLS